MDRDTYHQGEDLHDKNKVKSRYGGFTSTKPHADHRQWWSKSLTSWNVDGRRGYARKPAPEIKREFRVVRDNRSRQNVVADVTESFQKSHKDNHQGSSIVKEQSSSSGSVVDHYHTTTKNSNGHDLCQNLNGRSDSGPGLNKNEKSTESDIKSSTKEKTVTELGSLTELSKELKNNNTQAYTPNAVTGVYSSSLDPVHVPSSRPAGTVGTIRRKVGVVGVRRQVIDASNSLSSSLSEQDASSISKPTIPNMPVSRSFVTNYHLAKTHQQIAGHQKGINTNMEWKPKSSRKPNADDCISVTNMQPTGSSKEPSEVNLSNNKHVIIPEHLKVTKSEQADLIFGSFGVSGLDALRSMESPCNDPSASKSSLESVAIKDSDTDQSNQVESQARASQIKDSAYAAVKPRLSVQINDDYALSTRDIESYPDVEPNQKHIPSYTSFEPQRQNCSSFSEFLAHEPQMTIGMPFTKMTMQDNVQLQGSRSGQEITSSHVTNNNLTSITSMEQQPPQLPIQHLSPNYANLVPYRQIYPQMYFPQMLMSNYSNISVQNNHPSNRSSYLMMPGGSPQLATESMKYKPSVQSVPPTVGYGNYSNLGLYAFGSTPGMIDASGVNYNKDNNLYVPNPQVQSENGMWIQNPREVSTFRPTPCYNMPTQSPGLQTFMPANPALNQPAYPSSQLQYTGFYPPPQPGSVVGPSNPQVNSAFGMIPASPTQLVGPYQQHQLGHLGWTNANF